MPMLKWAGHGFANAHPDVLASREITAGNDDNDDDGVALLLERLATGG